MTDKDIPICKCGDYIFETDHEGYPNDICGNCTDLAIEKSLRDREWQHYHLGQGMSED